MPGGQGSYGNGAAMRIAPLGFTYRNLADQPAKLRSVVTAAVDCTHTHPEAVESALILALAVARLSNLQDSDVLQPSVFIRQLHANCENNELKSRLDGIATALARTELKQTDSADSKSPYFCAEDKELLQGLCTPGKWFQIRGVDAVTYVLFFMAKYGGIDAPRGTTHARQKAEDALIRMVAIGMSASESYRLEAASDADVVWFCSC
jgi:poly(ADP-ribose) glycohydrolase ARH3